MIRKVLAENAIKVKCPQSLRYANDILRLYHSDRTSVIEYQRKQLEQMLLHAYRHTKYYHDVFERIELIKEDSICWEKYSQIPILTKEIIRNNWDKLRSDDFIKRRAFSNTSGGSTGEPVLFLQDKQYFEKNFGNKILFGMLNDKYPGEKEIKIWGSERDIKEGTIGCKEKFINFCYNRELLNSFVLSDPIIDSYITRINSVKPKQIWSYVDSIYQIARRVIQTKQNIFCPQNIITTAGVLYDDMRSVIQEAFPSSKIMNQYGSREVGAIGVEINGESGIHLFEHSVNVEVLNEETNTITTQGQGRLIVSSLINFSMPLIRFDIGDIGEIIEMPTEPCRILVNLQGRVNSHIKLQDGKMIHGEYFTHLFYGREWVNNFQIVQHSFSELEIYVVIREGYEMNQADVVDIINNIMQVMGKECEIRFTQCKDISRLKSGKYQFVVSEI